MVLINCYHIVYTYVTSKYGKEFLLHQFSVTAFLILELVLKQEQEEYLREGIEWTKIEYFNNEIICELVERPHLGLLAIMDEACLNVGKVNDEVRSQHY